MQGMAQNPNGNSQQMQNGPGTAAEGWSSSCPDWGYTMYHPWSQQKGFWEDDAEPCYTYLKLSWVNCMANAAAKSTCFLVQISNQSPKSQPQTLRCVAIF